MSAPYGRSVEEVFGSPGKNPLSKAALSSLKELAPYLATPLRSLVQELKSRGCAAVLCQEYEFPLFDVCVATQRLHKLPVFGVFQGGDYRRWRIEGAIRPRTVRAAAGLIVPSVAERTRVAESYPGSRAEAIPNPVDLSIWRPREKERAREELGIRPGAVVVAWHGRVQMWKKGLDVLVDAWAELSRPGDLDAHLLLIGGGGDAADLSRRLGDHQITDFTWIDRYVHAREEIAEMLAAADIYAFPSRHEGFPVAPLEAMACGLPVVAADVSGIRDVIGAETGSGGILVPVADVGALAAGLRNLVVDPEIRRLKGLAARAQAESYGTAAIGAALRRLFVDR
jgi:starch synthase